MVNIAIAGAGKGGSALLDILDNQKEVNIVGIVDTDKKAPGLIAAKERNIFVADKIDTLVALSPHIVINATGIPSYSETIKKTFPYPVDVLEGPGTLLLWTVAKSHKKAQTDLEDLYESSTMVSAAHSFREALDRIVTRSMRITGSPGGSVVLIEGDELVLSSHKGLRAGGVTHDRWQSSGNRLASKVLKGKRPVAFHNIKNNPLFKGSLFLREGINSLLASPLSLNSHTIGILCLHDIKARRYSKREKNLIGLLSTTAAQIIEKFKLLDEKKKSLAYLQCVLNDSQDMIVATDKEGRIVKLSQGGERILGFSKEEMIGKKIAGFYANKDERAEILKMLEEKGAIYNYETTLLKKDGSPVDISLTISQLKDNDNNVVGTVGISKNVTVEKRLRKELEEKNRELERINESLEQKVLERTSALEKTNRELIAASEMKSRFIANASHELRTPLNSVIGFSELLLEKSYGEINEKQERYITNILNSGVHLLHIVNNILDLAKIESGRTDLLYDEFKLDDVVDEVFSVLSPIAGKKNIKLINEIPSGREITADRIKIKQVLYNLFSNAIKFTPAGGETGIRLENVKGDALLPWVPAGEEFIKLSVWDTGMGIRDVDLEKVFYEFEQVDSSKATEGSGLGLSLTKKLVEIHGGCIDVESRVGEGSTFNVYLPAITPMYREKEDVPHSPFIMPDTSENDNGPLVLVAEDDLATSEILTIHLTQAGYRVAHAYDGAEAIRKAREEKPFVIALDIMLPKKDGWEVLQELQADKETCKIPVIIHSMIENRTLAFALGASDYLVKPASKEMILGKLQSLHLPQRQRQKPLTVLAVTRDRDFQQSLQNVLDDQKNQFLVHFTGDAHKGIELALALAADTIIIDTSVKKDGFKIVAEYQNHPLLKDTPLFVLTAQGSSAEAKGDMSMQIEAILKKDALSSNKLLAHLNKLKILHPWRAGLVDELTGLFNSRYFDIRIAQEASRAKRYNASFAIAVLQLDHFERVEQNPGRDKAERILTKVAEFLRENLRTSDVVSRYRTDTFVMIFSNTSLEASCRVAQRFSSAIARLLVKTTVSIGLTDYHGQSVMELLKIAEAALSLAKEKGGNGVEIINGSLQAAS